ncbi:hypothetical protein PMI08_04708 [Brevibacillus sp. CF112]|nr:hypothetical protein PMI08_04708 [Brevibacillus sp. CF112]
MRSCSQRFCKRQLKSCRVTAICCIQNFGFIKSKVAKTLTIQFEIGANSIYKCVSYFNWFSKSNNYYFVTISLNTCYSWCCNISKSNFLLESWDSFQFICAVNSTFYIQESFITLSKCTVEGDVQSFLVSLKRQFVCTCQLNSIQEIVIWILSGLFIYFFAKYNFDVVEVNSTTPTWKFGGIFRNKPQAAQGFCKTCCTTICRTIENGVTKLQKKGNHEKVESTISQRQFSTPFSQKERRSPSNPRGLLVVLANKSHVARFL